VEKPDLNLAQFNAAFVVPLFFYGEPWLAGTLCFSSCVLVLEENFWGYMEQFFVEHIFWLHPTNGFNSLEGT